MQKQLIDVYGYKNFLNSYGFDIVREINQFVREHAKYRKDFKNIYGGLP